MADKITRKVRQILEESREYTQRLSDAETEAEHNCYRIKLKANLRCLGMICDECGILDVERTSNILRGF